MTHVVLIGNPNCGKTTLFNALTGEHQRVGNWPGVTVEKKTGSWMTSNNALDITDLPGIYSLTVTEGSGSQDEKIAAKALISLSPDIIINVVDACHLERHLYLTSQLLELKKPVVMALNMMDIARSRGISIDVEKLSQELNCPVIALEAHKKVGIEALKTVIEQAFTPTPAIDLALPANLKEALARCIQQLESRCGISKSESLYYAYRYLEGDTLLVPDLNIALQQDGDIFLADARYQKIHQIIEATQKKVSDVSEHFTAKLDKIILNRYCALPIFFAMMYLMFLFAINVGGAFQDFFDISTSAIFVDGSTWLLQQFHSPQWIIALIANGIGVGINTTLTFIPVIASMYFFLALLESSGYMARAAFVVDKIMRLLGLPGKSFVPMIVGFGCNVPAIMSARTLDSERDRLLTVLMSPFMSCSARLAIYAVFVAAFFPEGGQNVVFCLYLVGILAAVLTGLLLRKTLLCGQASPLIIELPAYHCPKISRLLRETSLRLRYFITRAGRMIIPVCILLGGLNALTLHGGVSHQNASPESLLSMIGQWLTPLFSPLGLTRDNWPATVGLLTGMLAKEVVVGTLNSLYTQINDVQTSIQSVAILASLKEALWSIPNNLGHLGDAVLNPVLASAPDGELSRSAYGVMASRFNGPAGAFAYLLFILLYIPCVSTMAAIRQETNRLWMWFSVLWSFLIAYAAAVIFYQCAFFSQHPLSSSAWILALLGAMFIFIAGLYYYSFPRRNHAPANS